MANAESGASTEQSGAQSETTTDEVTPVNESTEQRTVSLSDHKRVLDDMHKFKRELSDLRNDQSQREATSLAEKEDWKALSEKYMKERDESTSKLEKERTSYQHDVKYRAVKDAALKAGLRNERDLNLIPLDEIKIEYTSEGRMIVNGVDAFIKDLKKDREHWFQDKTVPNFNSGGAGAASAESETLTATRVFELEQKYKREGNKQKVKELYDRYNKQKQSKAG